jgi:DNA-binding NtrC family response regulator
MRGNDVLLLARHFLERFNRTLKKGPVTLTAEAEPALLGYGWPGNVRELRNLMERALILSEDGRIGPTLLPSDLQAQAFARQFATPVRDGLPTLREVEEQFVQYVLDRLGGNLSQAARTLGISRNTLKARLRGVAGADSDDLPGDPKPVRS